MSKTMTPEQAKTIREAFDHMSQYLMELQFKLNQKPQMDNLYAAAQIVRDAVIAHTAEALAPAANGSPGSPDLNGRPDKAEALPMPKR